MFAQTLATKLFIPPTRNQLLHRSRLIERLNQGMGGKLTLVSGPAGFGKSTLLSEWVSQSELPVGWVSLDEDDNDWHRFAIYLIKGFQNISDGFASDVVEMIRSDQPRDREVFLPYFINQINEIQNPFRIILDDYHAITEPKIHDMMHEILENQPPQMHVIISTRSDPPWPLARWRVGGDLLEIRTQDLRFNLEETEKFINRIMDLGLSRQMIEQLEAQIEGWAAGLQMAALSIQKRDDVSVFFQTFSGSHRYVFDYLLDEVFLGLSPNIQDFLLTTSILDRMCAPLCDHVRNANDSQLILGQLDQMNLFVTPLDDHRSWYRYHHLFADLIQKISGQKYTAQMTDRHRKAREWYQDNGLISEAIHHGFAEGNLEFVADLIEMNFLAALEQRDWITLTRWLEALPANIIQSRPWLNVAYAYVLLSTGSTHIIAQLLQQAENTIKQIAEPESSHIRSNIAYIRAELAARSGDITETIDYARISLEHIQNEDKRLRCLVASILGTALQRCGAFEDASQVFTSGIAAGRTIGDSNAVISLYGDLIGLFVEQSKLHQAYAYCQEGLLYIESIYQKRGRYTPGAAHIHFRLSTILRHWNDLEGSLHHARVSNAILKKWGIRYRLNFVNLAIALHAVGDYPEAHRVLQEAKQVARQQSDYWMENVKAIQVLFWLAEGNLEAASQWVSERTLDKQDEIDYKNQLIFRTLARVHLVQGQGGDNQALNQAIRLLAKLERMYEVSGATAYLIQTSILQALAYQAKSKSDQALNSIKRAIALGEDGGYLYVFVREGRIIDKLLHKIVASGEKTTYIEKLLSALEKQQKDIKKSDPELIIELLTDRELEILILLDSEMTVSEIADSLVISIGTARTHVKRIYRKLDVHSRFEAVAKARKLNLIPRDQV